MAENMTPALDLAPGQTPALNEATLPKSTPDTQAREFTGGEVEQRITPTRWQSFVTSLKLGSDSSPLGFMPDDPGALIRMYTQSQLESQNAARGVLKISANEANQKYPGMEVPFSTPVDPYVAELQYQDHMRRQRNREWVSRGEQRKLDQFAAGLVGGFADPLNFALSVATGGAFRAAKIGGTIGSTFLENLAVNIGTESIVYTQAKREQQAVSVGESLTGAVEGAIGGTAFHYAVLKPMASVAEAALSKAKEFVSKTPKDIREQNMRMAIAQHESGAKIDVTPSAEVMHARMKGEVANAPPVYSYQPLEHPSDSTFYMARAGEDNAPVKFQEYGPGTYAVDNGMVANNMVAGGEPGKVGVYNPPKEMKFLSLETPAKDLKDIVAKVEAATGLKLDIQEGDTFKDVLTKVSEAVKAGETPEASLSAIKDTVQQAGYDGYKYVEDFGSGKPAHNGVVLFDENQAPHTVYDARTDLAPSLSGDQVAAYYNDSTKSDRSMTYSSELQDEIRKSINNPSVNSKPDYLDPIHQEQFQAHMEQLKELAKEDPSIVGAIQEIQRETATAKQESEVTKGLADCISRSIV